MLGRVDRLTNRIEDMGRALGVVLVGVGLAWLMVTPVRGQSNWFSSWSAGNRPVASPRPAVVRVIAEDADGHSQGTGTLVAVSDRHGIVITNWHVVRDATGRIRVVFPDGFESAAQVLKTDADWDLAALGIWRPSAKPLSIAHVAPVAGEPLTIAGYGPGEYREVTGRLIQYVAPSAQLPYEMFEVDVEARNGDSGGPILNARGELAGVLFGAASGTTAGSYCGRVRQFLDSVLPLIDSAAQQVASARRPAATSAVPATAPRSAPPPRPATPPRTAHLADNRASAGAGSPTAAPPMEPVRLPQLPVSSVRSQPLAPVPVAKADRSPQPSQQGSRLVSALRVLGDTPLDQVKTFLAIVGVVSIVLQVTGGRRRE